MPYTTHGHWYGPGEPTQPGPRFKAKCFGLGGCAACRADAGLPPLPEPQPAAKPDAAPVSTERLAEILWTSRALALGDDPADHPFAEVSARMRTQYVRQAAEVAKLLGQDRDAEVERLRSELFEVREGKDEIDTEATVWHDEFQKAKDEVEQLRAELEQRRHDLGERLHAVPGEPWGELLASAEQQRRALVSAQTLAVQRARERSEAEAERDRFRKQRDQARMAVDRADTLANEAETTVAPLALSEAIADVAQLCPGCWRTHGLWCHPYGGPMADPDPAAYRKAIGGEGATS